VKFRFRFAEWLNRLFHVRSTDLPVHPPVAADAVHQAAAAAAVDVLLLHHPAAAVEAAAVAVVVVCK
jgi:hypothetical protein